jgi:hypothetical protein
MNLEKVGECVRRFWLLSAISTALLFAGIFGAAADYGKAQGATDIAAFKHFVPAAAVGDFKLAALIDVLFSIGYGLLALALSSYLRGKSGRGISVARRGCSAVFAAAVLDEFENFAVLFNLANRNHVSELSIDVMTSIGKAKWFFVFVGFALVLVGVILRTLRTTATLRDLG